MYYNVDVLIVCFMREGVLVPIYVCIDKYGDILRILFSC